MNILLLMTDQQRWDHAGFMPGSVLNTPNLHRIAEGTVFTHCQSVNPLCQPARTALLTGRYSRQIGTLNMSGDLNFNIPTFPQALQRAGYWTAGIGKFHYLQTWPWGTPECEGVDHVALNPEMRSLGFDYVWETSGKQLALQNHCDYTALLESRGLLDAYREMVRSRGANHAEPDPELALDGDPWPFAEDLHIDAVTGEKIRETIRSRPKDQPFFIKGSFCSPHKPFDPPQRFFDETPYEERDDFLPGDNGSLSGADKKNLWKLRRAYRATLRLLDHEVGKILDLMQSEGLMEDTLILFTSDHGEMMGDHGKVQKSLWYRESLNVPTAIRHPRYVTGARNDSPVELTDLTATMLDAAGLDPRAALSRPWPAFNNLIPARSLLPLIRAEASRVRDFAYAECRNQWICLTTQRHKYVRLVGTPDPDHPVELLFDLVEDPGEQINLAGLENQHERLEWFRRRACHVQDQTPPVQQCWAPLMGAGSQK
ncbi:MAG: sulfatase-like hydrolase/transferase [Kiritimatiellia bacterium]